MIALIQTLLVLALLGAIAVMGAGLGLGIRRAVLRRRLTRLKRSAVLTLVRDEIEANLFAIMSLSRNLEDLGDNEDGERIVQLQTQSDGAQYLYLEDDGSDYRSAYPIRPVETGATRANLVALPEIDAALFASLRDYIGLMREAERIRKDLVEHLQGQHGGPAKVSEFFFEDMVIRGRKRLIRIEEALRMLLRNLYSDAASAPDKSLPPGLEAKLTEVRGTRPRTTPQ